MERIKKVIEWVNKWPVAKWMMIAGAVITTMNSLSDAQRALVFHHEAVAVANLIAAATSIILIYWVYKTPYWWRVYLGMLLIVEAAYAFSSPFGIDIPEIVVSMLFNIGINYLFYRWDLIQRGPQNKSGVVLGAGAE